MTMTQQELVQAAIRNWENIGFSECDIRAIADERYGMLMEDLPSSVLARIAGKDDPIAPLTREYGVYGRMSAYHAALARMGDEATKGEETQGDERTDRQRSENTDAPIFA